MVHHMMSKFAKLLFQINKNLYEKCTEIQILKKKTLFYSCICTDS